MTDRDEEIADLKRQIKELQYFKIRYEIWKQFYGQLLAVPVDTDEDTRVKRQARIISDMQDRIRGQRNQINRLLNAQRDHLKPGPFARYNVYRHCNKLYQMWREATGA